MLRHGFATPAPRSSPAPPPHDQRAHRLRKRRLVVLRHDQHADLLGSVVDQEGARQAQRLELVEPVA